MMFRRKTILEWCVRVVPDCSPFATPNGSPIGGKDRRLLRRKKPLNFAFCDFFVRVCERLCAALYCGDKSCFGREIAGFPVVLIATSEQSLLLDSPRRFIHLRNAHTGLTKCCQNFWLCVHVRRRFAVLHTGIHECDTNC